MGWWDVFGLLGICFIGFLIFKAFDYTWNKVAGLAVDEEIANKKWERLFKVADFQAEQIVGLASRVVDLEEKQKLIKRKKQ